jgi:hypothetical protein
MIGSAESIEFAVAPPASQLGSGWLGQKELIISLPDGPEQGVSYLRRYLSFLSLLKTKTRIFFSMKKRT